MAELMPCHQFAVEQKVNSVVERSPRNTVILVIHELEERFNIKVPFPGIYLVKNCIPLGCFPQRMGCKVLRKNLPDNRPGFFV